MNNSRHTEREGGRGHVESSGAMKIDVVPRFEFRWLPSMNVREGRSDDGRLSRFAVVVFTMARYC